MQISGRKYMVISFTTTYCLAILGCLLCAIWKKLSIEVFLAMFAGFTPMLVLINEWYFKREDRERESS